MQTTYSATPYLKARSIIILIRHCFALRSSATMDSEIQKCPAKQTLGICPGKEHPFGSYVQSGWKGRLGSAHINFLLKPIANFISLPLPKPKNRMTTILPFCPVTLLCLWRFFRPEVVYFLPILIALNMKCIFMPTQFLKERLAKTIVARVAYCCVIVIIWLHCLRNVLFFFMSHCIGSDCDSPYTRQRLNSDRTCWAILIN